MRGLNLLFDSGIKVRLKTVAMQSNVDELLEMARFCKERTGQRLQVDPIIHLRLDGDMTRNEEIKSERLSPQEIAALERLNPKLLKF
jgi:molybdenum cofactor biosynthesis enzyme MoaA